MKRTFYEKVGRKYIPVKEYDSELMDGFPAGAHLVLCTPGSKTRRFNINPNYAAMIAAGYVAEEAISKALMKASDMRPSKNPITPEQKKAWEKLSEAFGEESHLLQWPSIREATEAGVKAMMGEAEKLLSNPSVKKAFDEFILVCELSK